MLVCVYVIWCGRESKISWFPENGPSPSVFTVLIYHDIIASESFWINFHWVTLGVGGKCIGFRDLTKCLSFSCLLPFGHSSGRHSKSEKVVVEIKTSDYQLGKCHQKPYPILLWMGKIYRCQDFNLQLVSLFLVKHHLFLYMFPLHPTPTMRRVVSPFAFRRVRCVPNWASKWLMAWAFSCYPWRRTRSTMTGVPWRCCWISG